ncbi:hypothetical protein ACHQM5_005209 [Ranunculus cassubicifolius]
MRAAAWSELEVDLPAEEMWAVYSSPDLPKLIVDLMPARFQSIDYVEGDGSQGTTVHITLQPTNSGPLTWDEQFVIIDDATMTKVVRQVSGGYLGIGFNMYENIFQITARGANACTVRATGSYDVTEAAQGNSSMISASWRMAMVIRDYIKAQKAAAAAAQAEAEAAAAAAAQAEADAAEAQAEKSHGHGHGHGHGRGRGHH